MEEQIPTPQKDEVLLSVKRIGICGSDLHVYNGKHPLTTYPVTQGHEVAAVVEDIGEDIISDLEIGNKVTVQPQVTCGECYYCISGKHHICNNLKVMGFQSEGLAAEYATINPERLHKIPEELSIDEAAMIEPLAVACSAAEKLGSIENTSLLILGAGPIGNLTGQVTKAQGAEKVMITDIIDFRLGIAQSVGIDHTVNPENEDLENAIIDSFGEPRADYIVECVGGEQTTNQAIELSRKGSEILMVGVFGEKPKIDMSTIQDHELHILGLLMYQERHFQQAIDLVEKGKVNLKTLISKHYNFLDYDLAYQDLERGKDQFMKILIDVN